jgi:hypothetical protein
MRLPLPELARDPFFDLVGQRIALNVDGNVIKGRLLWSRLWPSKDAEAASQKGRNLKTSPCRISSNLQLGAVDGD